MEFTTNKTLLSGNYRSYFQCWACKKVYVKTIREHWNGWSCPICRSKTNGCSISDTILTNINGKNILAAKTYPPTEVTEVSDTVPCPICSSPLLKGSITLATVLKGLEYTDTKTLAKHAEYYTCTNCQKETRVFRAEGCAFLKCDNGEWMMYYAPHQKDLWKLWQWKYIRTNEHGSIVVNDKTVSDRICLKCGKSYYGERSECPHSNRVTSFAERL